MTWALLLLAAHSVPGTDLVYDDPWELFRIDKLAHASMFAVFVVMLMVAFRKQDVSRTLKFHARKWSTIVACSYGAMLEFYQGYCYTGRTTEVLDFVADSIGCLLGLLLFRFIYGSELARV